MLRRVRRLEMWLGDLLAPRPGLLCRVVDLHFRVVALPCLVVALLR